MASYKQAIQWIADNDCTLFLFGSNKYLIPSVSLSLVADIFNKPIEKAIKDLRKAVKKNNPST